MQLDMTELGIGLCNGRILCFSYHTIQLSLWSLSGTIAAAGPKAEKQPRLVLLCPMYGCLKECFVFLDTLGSRGTDDRNQYVLPRLYGNLAMIISYTHTHTPTVVNDDKCK